MLRARQRHPLELGVVQKGLLREAAPDLSLQGHRESHTVFEFEKLFPDEFRNRRLEVKGQFVCSVSAVCLAIFPFPCMSQWWGGAGGLILIAVTIVIHITNIYGTVEPSFEPQSEEVGLFSLTKQWKCV